MKRFQVAGLPQAGIIPPRRQIRDGSNDARLAQLVEQLICNHQVAGSSPASGSM